MDLRQDLRAGDWRRATRSSSPPSTGSPSGPPGRVLVDYNQNAWGRTLASVYSVRPQPRATVSTPVTWKEIEQGIAIEDFRLDNVPARVARSATSGSPSSTRGRFRLEKVPLMKGSGSPRSTGLLFERVLPSADRKREKSRSALQSVRPCSMASAARWSIVHQVGSFARLGEGVGENLRVPVCRRRNPATNS